MDGGRAGELRQLPRLPRRAHGASGRAGHRVRGLPFVARASKGAHPRGHRGLTDTAFAPGCDVGNWRRSRAGGGERGRRRRSGGELCHLSRARVLPHLPRGRPRPGRHPGAGQRPALDSDRGPSGAPRHARRADLPEPTWRGGAPHAHELRDLSYARELLDLSRGYAPRRRRAAAAQRRTGRRRHRATPASRVPRRELRPRSRGDGCPDPGHLRRLPRPGRLSRLPPCGRGHRAWLSSCWIPGAAPGGGIRARDVVQRLPQQRRLLLDVPRRRRPGEHEAAAARLPRLERPLCNGPLGGRRFDPHGPGFDAERLRRKNPQMCTVCHGAAIPTP